MTMKSKIHIYSITFALLFTLTALGCSDSTNVAEQESNRKKAKKENPDAIKEVPLTSYTISAGGNATYTLMATEFTEAELDEIYLLNEKAKLLRDAWYSSSLEEYDMLAQATRDIVPVDSLKTALLEAIQKAKEDFPRAKKSWDKELEKQRAEFKKQKLELHTLPERIEKYAVDARVIEIQHRDSPEQLSLKEMEKQLYKLIRKHKFFFVSVSDLYEDEGRQKYIEKQQRYFTKTETAFEPEAIKNRFYIHRRSAMRNAMNDLYTTSEKAYESFINDYITSNGMTKEIQTNNKVAITLGTGAIVFKAKRNIRGSITGHNFALILAHPALKPMDSVAVNVKHFEDDSLREDWIKTIIKTRNEW